MKKDKVNELEMKLITASRKAIENYNFGDSIPELIISYKYNSKKEAKLNIKIYLNGDKRIAEVYLHENGAAQFKDEYSCPRRFLQEISSQYNELND